MLLLRRFIYFLHQSKKLQGKFQIHIMPRATKRYLLLFMCVDTASGSVDTRPISQKIFFAQLGQCVDTLNGSVDTLRLKLKNVNLSGHVAAWGSRESA
ncbi:hypothetical protein Taro_035664 [Colocasia esculenta]|uniref:Uncharacterized protein n=1 Tax=Colocasia esculenta TaxID=4460 RepID=A0A843VV46_COLES|nr:hypothetical protein [Colocasia esculenta]